MRLQKMTYLFLIFPMTIFSHQTELQHNANPFPEQILHLLVTQKTEEAVQAYLNLYRQEGRHNFHLLEKMCLKIIENGTSSNEEIDHTLTLFGISLSGMHSHFLPFLQSCLSSSSFRVQLMALQVLNQIHEDSIDQMIAAALLSNFLQVRISALFYLIQRKNSCALGQVSSLMHLLPPQIKPYFVEFYAQEGSHDALQSLKKFMNDPNVHVRICAILFSALYQRDDLLPNIRSCLTHSEPEIKEAACFAIGHLKDLLAMNLLTAISKSPFAEIKLAAALALYRLGDKKIKEEIFLLAKNGHPFAVYALGELEEKENIQILEQLLSHPKEEVQINAALALLRLKNPRSLPIISKILQTDPQKTGFFPVMSRGQSLLSWKAISMSLIPHHTQQSIRSISLSFQKQLLTQSLELPRLEFLSIAEKIMENLHIELLPLLIKLLENENSPEIKSLLQKKTFSLGKPFLRGYCKLALYRMHGEIEEYRKSFFTWLMRQKFAQLIEFQTALNRKGQNNFDTKPRTQYYTLTPKASTQLWIEALLAISFRHEEEGLEFLLEALHQGHKKNQFVIAGLILQAIH